jgi:hypothetical protein
VQPCAEGLAGVPAGEGAGGVGELGLGGEEVVGELRQDSYRCGLAPTVEWEACAFLGGHAHPAEAQAASSAGPS